MSSYSLMSPDYASYERKSGQKTFICLRKIKRIPYLIDYKMKIKKNPCGRFTYVQVEAGKPIPELSERLRRELFYLGKSFKFYLFNGPSKLLLLCQHLKVNNRSISVDIPKNYPLSNPKLRKRISTSAQFTITAAEYSAFRSFIYTTDTSLTSILTAWELFLINH